MKVRMSLKRCLRIIGLLVIIATVFFSNISCNEPINQDATNSDDNSGDANQFAIYLVTNYSGIPYSKAPDLSQLELQDEPWLSINDINFYDFSTHMIYLKEGKSVPMVQSTIPFVVVAKGERCYSGYFLSPISSYAPMEPTIQTWLPPGDYIKDVVSIGGGLARIPGDTNVDVRDDERVAKALQDAGKYSAGLLVQLNEIAVVDQSATTLSYTFTVTNDDDENLYVPDPDKMGSNLFHYYMNGPYLQSLDGTTSFWSKYKTTTAPDHYDSWRSMEWFTKLKSHQSMKRTVILAGYPKIPAGKYSCYFDYNSVVPLHSFGAAEDTVDMRELILAGGRIWLGGLASNTIEVDIAS